MLPGLRPIRFVLSCPNGVEAGLRSDGCKLVRSTCPSQSLSNPRSLLALPLQYTLLRPSPEVVPTCQPQAKTVERNVSPPQLQLSLASCGVELNCENMNFVPINLFASGFQWLQSTFAYDILFARNLNFSTWLTKNVNILGTKQNLIMD